MKTKRTVIITPDIIDFPTQAAGVYLRFGDTAYGTGYGVDLRILTNPPSGQPIFRVLSSGGWERLRVEHDGKTFVGQLMRADGGFDVGGYTVISSGRVLKNIASVAQNLTPDADATRVLGSSTLRWSEAYLVAVTLGDLKFENGWAIKEDERYGLVLVSPSGKKYRFVLEEVKDV